MNRHGWGKYRKEGLLELERIKASKFFSGEDELLSLIEKYIKIYEEDRGPEFEITGTTFYPEFVRKAARKKAKKQLLELAAGDKGKISHLKKDAEDIATRHLLEQAERNRDLKEKLEEPAHQKASRSIGRLRKHLEDFYMTEEGKQSEYRIYFPIERRHYIGIRRVEANDSDNNMTAETERVEKTGAPLEPQIPHVTQGISSETDNGSDTVSTVTASNLSKVSEWFLDLLKIIPEAILEPNQLVLRSRKNGSFRWNALIICFFSLLLASAAFSRPAYSIRPIIPFNKIGDMLPVTLLIFFISTAIWCIYKNKYVRGTANFYEIINYQFYFFSGWMLVFTMLLSAQALAKHIGNSIALWTIQLTMIGLILMAIVQHYSGINKLMGISLRKGSIPFFLYLSILVIIVIL